MRVLKNGMQGRWSSQEYCHHCDSKLRICASDLRRRVVRHETKYYVVCAVCTEVVWVSCLPGYIKERVTARHYRHRKP